MPVVREQNLGTMPEEEQVPARAVPLEGIEPLTRNVASSPIEPGHELTIAGQFAKKRRLADSWSSDNRWHYIMPLLFLSMRSVMLRLSCPVLPWVYWTRGK